jgi:hypothetical protein
VILSFALLASAAVAAKTHFFPTPFPFLPPGEGALANQTDFARKIFFFYPLHSSLTISCVFLLIENFTGLKKTDKVEMLSFNFVKISFACLRSTPPRFATFLLREG